MEPTSVVRLICFALFFLSAEASGLRSRRGHAHHARTNSVESNINSPKTHQVLLNGGQCKVPLPPETKAPKLNIWDNLHRGTANDIQKWLTKEAPELNLTHATYSTHGNYISSVDLMQPNKTDVCCYERSPQTSTWNA